ncbi:site-2 protease family protein [Basilea psittacipulmonis]|uniref:Peptidase M50 n=1 Tax=Basilea psittacipulmonis DSM 24701 TaxID=1072685 RepID=A0A077DBZ8_9BURK|nr:site-2 protease family protein [Basilea psittacipulmonis]AIL32179.1 hypothetical protein IX83_01595 [Basilea psittacipulmonis DSM 24701]
MSFNDQIQILVCAAIPFIFALTLSEAAKAFTARMLGDDSALTASFCSLNPGKFIDPIGTILMPLGLMLLGSPVFFGWAKPVLFNPNKFKNFNKGLALVVLSGPFANFLMAVAWMLILCLAIYLRLDTIDVKLLQFVVLTSELGVIINVVLILFNLLPIPPLPGSYIVMNLLPARYAIQYAGLKQYNLFIILFLVVTGAFRVIFGPVVLWTNSFINSLISHMTLM